MWKHLICMMVATSYSNRSRIFTFEWICKSECTKFLEMFKDVLISFCVILSPKGIFDWTSSMFCLITLAFVPTFMKLITTFKIKLFKRILNCWFRVCFDTKTLIHSTGTLLLSNLTECHYILFISKWRIVKILRMLWNVSFYNNPCLRKSQCQKPCLQIFTKNRLHWKFLIMLF